MMTEESLNLLSKAEVIHLFLDYQQKMEAQVQELKQKIEALSRPAKTPENSSLPPSSGHKANRQSRRRRARKAKRKGKSRKRVEPDVTIECRATRCEHCGTDLSDVPQRFMGRSQIVELPPTKPVVVEAERYGCFCPHCHQRQSGAYPPGMEPQRVFGSRVEGIVTFLHEHHHLSYLRLQMVLQVLFGLQMSVGALVNIIDRVANQLKPAVEEIREQIRGSPVVGSDETGARIDGQNHWQWVFVTEQATYHVMASSRAGRVIREVMGEAQPLVWVSDMWSAQLAATTKHHQLCLAHQLRDLEYAIEADGSAWAYRMQRFFRAAIRLGKRRDELPAERYEIAVQQMEKRLDALLQQRAKGPEAVRLKDRYRIHRESLLVFLHLPNVPPHNNASERALRNSVIHRKVIGSFRSQWGADAHAAVASIMDTARKQGVDAFDAIMSLLAPTAPIPGLEAT